MTVLPVYLIDYENVNADGLNGVSRLGAKDRVIIFYSENADRMTFGLHRRLNETAAGVEYKRVEVGGHNALDFQLATYLGWLVAQAPQESYIIVSNDKGFEWLASFWKAPKYDVRTSAEIAVRPAPAPQKQPAPVTKQPQAAPAAKPQAAPAAPQPPAEETAAQLVRLGLTEEEAAVVCELLGHYKTKTGVNNALVKKFGSARASELYDLVKKNFLTAKKTAPAPARPR